MKNFLSEDERALLRYKHKKERDKRICDRIKAVLLYDQRWSYEQIARVLLLTDEAVRRHVLDYTEYKKLKPENGGSKSKLSKMQEKKLEKHLQKHIYLYVKDIAAYVQATFGIHYSISGLRDWLLSHDFSYKKPAIVPGKADLKEQEKWIEKYKEFKKDLSSQETICFIDGVHPTHNNVPAYGWIKRGQNKTIATNSRRSRLRAYLKI